MLPSSSLVFSKFKVTGVNLEKKLYYVVWDTMECLPDSAHIRGSSESDGVVFVVRITYNFVDESGVETERLDFALRLCKVLNSALWS